MEITINYDGVELDIDYSFQPYEAAERGPEAQYPGCGACVDGINSIKVDGVDFTELYEDDEEEISEAIMEAMGEEAKKHY